MYMYMYGVLYLTPAIITYLSFLPLLSLLPPQLYTIPPIRSGIMTVEEAAKELVALEEQEREKEREKERKESERKNSNTVGGSGSSSNSAVKALSVGAEQIT